MTAVQSLQIGSGSSAQGMPMVGLGCFQTSDAEAEQLVYEALKAGYRHLDCACDYGNEKGVGRGLQKAIGEGICARADVFVTSKLWNTYHRREHVEPACRRTLTDIGLEYVDLYLVHFPIAMKFVPFEERYPPEWSASGGPPNLEEDLVPFQETWEAMEALQQQGLARNIGVCNMTSSGVRDILSYAKIPPAVLQVENHAHLQQTVLVDWCKAKGIAVTGFAPLGGSAYQDFGWTTAADLLVNDPAVTGIAGKVGKSPAQVLIRSQVQRGIIAIPKTKTVARLAENLDVFSFELSAEDMAVLKGLEKGRRYNNPSHFANYPIYE